MARPTGLTPETADRVAKLIRAGNWPEASAVAAGGLRADLLPLDGARPYGR